MENRRKSSGGFRKPKAGSGGGFSKKGGSSRSFGGGSRGSSSPKSRGRFGAKGRGKDLDPELFIKKARPVKETKYNPTRVYDDFDIHESLKSILAKNNFREPTEIQDKTIDESISGQNILGIASTGTGKTGAFLIPIIDRFLKGDKDFRTLVVVPTRELALQVKEDLDSMTRGFGLFSICLVGGTPTFKDVKRLRMKNHIVIGTPGRLIDMVKREALKLVKTEVLILDEFDRMLDMGFVDDVRFLKQNMPNLNQTMLFSATLDKKLKPIVDEVIKNPFTVMVNSGGQSSDNVEQDVILIKKGEAKFDKLLSMLKQDTFEKTIIFAETKRAVDLVSKNLAEAGMKVEYIHGDKTQRSREFSLKKFKDGRSDILVATDVAARGLDIKGITHVINYEKPRDYESYIHRIGRTGRAGKTGTALTFI
jgi:ATP-dependent RNA helicase RhlE